MKPKKMTLAEAKIQAAFLLKDWRSNDEAVKVEAAKRLIRVYENLSQEVKLKHALETIAFEQRFASWRDLKMQIGLVRFGFLNHWFSTYAEAKKYQQQYGGFLFPYKQQFFVCDQDYLIALGFDPDDADWQLVNYDWVEPTNQEAFKRLCQQWNTLQE